MTLFEYISIALSLLLALTFAEGLRGLRSALRPDRRYGVHVAWLLLKITNPIVLWWGTWGYRDIPEYWNFATYSLVLVLPALVFLQVSSLVGDTPYQVTDWRKHFYDQRRWFFGLQIIAGFLAMTVLSGFIPSSIGMLVPALGYAFLTFLSVIGFVSENSKVHGLIVSLSIGFNILYYGIATFQPMTL